MSLDLGRKVLIVLEMIKVEHTVFALPFAYLGAFVAARGWPGWSTCWWILVAMVGARSAAMAFNRLVDRRYDALNPRTQDRALPRGLLTPGFVAGFVVAGSALLFLAAWMLNPLALALAGPALVVVLGYSYTKRFTSWSHVILGLSLGIAPAGGWVAVSGTLEPAAVLLTGAVTCWVAGFDIIYSCQDVAFDERTKLHSVPRRLGIGRALKVAAALHLVMILLLAWAFSLFDLGWPSWLGLVLVAGALVYEHRLVRPDDLRRVNAAFFSVNGVVSIVLFVSVGLDLCLFV